MKVPRPGGATVFGATVVVSLFFSSAAPRPVAAAVTEPNGTVVPAPPTNTETGLQSYFTSQNEAINAINDASTEPGVFMPLCDFQATLVLSQSQAAAGLAWYNATANPMGPPAAVYQIGAPALMLGQTIASADIRSSPNYAGGLIGFALTKPALGPIYYSEHQRNVFCSGCTMPGTWKMALAYRSTVSQNAYYVAWEDWEGANSTTWHGNDGDFNDKVFRITGVTCNGGGETCTTGMPGICATGITECRVGGATICKGLTPTAEQCDNLDNDCNGMVDDNAPCPQNGVCSKGVCIHPCNDTEFPCDIGYRCESGLCVEASCAGKTCGAGQICRGGNCIGGCEGVRCPLGQECLPDVGVCVDLCRGVSCPGGVCERGACVTTCECRGCPLDKRCAADGRCVDIGCQTITCGAGELCKDGSCQDPCANAICPGGAACRNGTCEVPNTVPTGAAGTGGSATGFGGTTGAAGRGAAGRGAAGAGGRGGSGAAGSSTGGSGTSGDGGTDARPAGRGGTCGCAAAEAPPTAAGLFLVIAGLLGFVRRRSRRR